MPPDSDHPLDSLSPRDVLTAIYRATLDRAPDPDGLAYWTSVLKNGVAERPVDDVVGEIITAFVATPEGHRKLVATLAGHPDAAAEIRQGDAARAALREEFLLPDTHLPGAHRADAGGRLRNVVGLGTHCYTASLLARFGARSWSGPFDWVFSTPSMVRDCLKDGFEAFLDPDQYRVVPIEERADPDYNRVSHPAFERRYAIPAPIFNHTDAHTPEGQSYLRRCVERFENALRGGEPVRFLQIGKHTPDTEIEFARTLDVLRTRSEHPMLVQVAVHQTASATGIPLAETICENPTGRLLSFRPTSGWNATRFSDLLDDLMLMRAIEAAFAAIR